MPLKMKFQLGCAVVAAFLLGVLTSPVFLKQEDDWFSVIDACTNKVFNEWYALGREEQDRLLSRIDWDRVESFCIDTDGRRFRYCGCRPTSESERESASYFRRYFRYYQDSLSAG